MDSDLAFDLEARVLAARQVERRSWVLLAEQLAGFHHARAWEALGHERLVDWLGSPEVGIGPRTAYRLIQAWDWAGESGVSPEALGRVDLTKLIVVLPAIRNGSVSIEEALSDAESLSRTDLVAKYVGEREDGAGRVREREELRTTCEQCGRVVLEA